MRRVAHPRRYRLGRLVTALAVVALALGVPAIAARAGGGFLTGFADGIYESSTTPGYWLDRTVATGARFILLPVDWASVAPARPQTDPANPGNPAYNWRELDAAVRAAAARRLAVAFTVAGAGGPPWADGPHRPADVQPGTWRPSPGAFAAFALALARRYSGRFDPGSGTLPRVRYYQAWSEPNLDNHLTPQWIRVGRRWVAESPIIYRGLLNAFYAAVKSVHSSNLVITGGTAPFGDPPGGARIPPAEFVRAMLCVQGPRLTTTRCSNPAHFDILAHHPYAINGPWAPAINADDVSVPDLGKLTRPLAAAERAGQALPRGPKQLWVTEFSWDSSPPDPHGVPMNEHAHWLEEAFYVLWRQGVDAIAWYLLVDQPPVPSYATSYQSGVYFLGGRPKLSLQAFRFPFVVEPAPGARQTVWGIAPSAGTVLVQRLSAGHWRTILRVAVSAHGVFTRTISLAGRPLMRAQVGSETSLTWRVR
jgi:hypothetical protein